MNEDQFTEYLISIGVPAPNYVFSAELLDNSCSSERDSGWHENMPEKRENNNLNPGAYLWVDFGVFVTDETRFPVVLYAGKAIKLQNRLKQHWYNYSESFISRYYDAVFSETSLKNQLSGVPVIFVWRTRPGDRAVLEARLIEMLHPVYNRRKE